MSNRKIFQLGTFFLLFWLAVMLSSMLVHELGHGLAGMIAGGWSNSVVRFGQTDFLKQSFVLDAIRLAQTSGVTPETWGTSQQLELIANLARQELPFRYAILGGWIAQLVAAAIVFVLYRSRGFQAQASTFTRMFLGGVLLFNPAWLGGTWLLYGAWRLEDTDPIVLVDVILNGNPFAIAGLWIVSLGLIALALFLAYRYGSAMFAPLGFSEPGGRKMALYWTAGVAVIGFLIKLPFMIALMVAILLMIAVPLWSSMRLIKQGETVPVIPGYVWLGMSAIYGVVIFLVATNSGLLIGGDTGTLTTQAVESYYCRQVQCVPEDVLQWLAP
jgi:hypothetical protein